MSISDRILLMNRGELQQYDTPQNMYRFPANQFVAGFLGNPPINFIPCRKENGRLVVPENRDWNFDGLEMICCGSCGEQGILGIRPEDILVTQEGGQMSGEVAAIQTLGKEVYLKLLKGGISLTACLSWDHDYKLGDHLNLKAKKAYLFPEEIRENEK